MNKQPIHNLDELLSSIFKEAQPTQKVCYRQRIVEQTTKRGKIVRSTAYDEIPFQTWLSNYLQNLNANSYHQYTKNGYTFFSGNDPVLMLFPEKDGTIGWTW